MARVKQIIGWTAIVLFAATLAGIWVLTEQNAVQTSLLSESSACGGGPGYGRSGCRCHG